MEHNMADKKNRKKDKKRRRVFFLAAGIAVFLVLFGALGVYVFDSINFVFRGMSRIIPYPAMMINSRMCLYSEYADNIITMKKFVESQDTLVASEEEIRQRVAERLVANKVLEQMARDRGIKVFDYEIEKEFEQAIQGLGVEDEIEKNIKKLFGWNIDEYKTNVVQPFVLQKKLTQAIYDDDEDAGQKFSQYLEQEITTARVLYFVPH